MTAIRPTIHANPALYLSPEMVTELALGMDPPKDICARYGIADFEYAKMASQEWFGELVAKRRMDLNDNGQLFEGKARMMAEELYVRAYQQALTGGLTANLVIDLAKQLAEIGMPKSARATANMPTGPQFQININMPADRQGPGKAELARDITPPKVTVTIPADPIPPRPEGFRVPDFDLRRGALVGTPQAQQAALASTAQSR